MITFELLMTLVGIGAVVGTLAGLLGIGGGLLIVPALLTLLPKFGIPTSIAMQVALATSLACIILTSGSAAFHHFRLGNIDMFVVKFLLPGVVIGGVAGSFVADIIPSEYLPNIFGTIVLGLSIKMFVSVRSTKVKDLPNRALTFVAGSAIGTVSSLAGIGGGSLLVPYMSRHGIEMRKAIGSSSFCGTLLAASGMLGFIYHGLTVNNLPEYSVGFVYLPALAAIACTSMLFTNVGAKLASRMPTPLLKKCFALLLLFVALRMLLL
jgi:uncharacterized membrane protein YfcA